MSAMTQAEIVQDAAALARLCARLQGEAWVALDTEFMRVDTYYARLCLIQLATPEWVAVIDPLALGDLAPLLDLIYAPRLLKVIHSARQDLEVFADICRSGAYRDRGRQDTEGDRGTPPAPVFDTQIAAALCGHAEQIGYGALVEAVTGKKLAKLHTRADWARRPLAPELIRYAEEDVRDLCDVYAALAGRLTELGRAEWLAEECAALTDPALYRNDPELAFRRIKPGNQLAPPAQAVLAQLTAWREREAQSQNLPRNWVLNDAALMAIARAAPPTPERLGAIKDVHGAAVRKWGEAILEAVRAGQRAPARALFEPPVRLDPGQTELLARMQARVQAVAQELGIGASVLATRRDLLDLIREPEGGALLRGWRRAPIGEELLALRAAFAAQGG